METRTIENRRCHICAASPGSPILYWFVSTGDERIRTMPQVLSGLCSDRAFTLIAAEVLDWNAQLSPWPAPAAFGDKPFAGQGGDTLSWLRAAMPEIESGLSPTKRLIGGYSLSGLFALWALYETDFFDGAASCSGSLWYPGWPEYVNGRRLKAGSTVYLSLGDREEQTRNTLLSCVGERTRWQHAHLLEDPAVKSAALVWNRGGHFRDAQLRTAMGFAWLLEKTQ